MAKFKVGDIVRVKDWDYLKKHYFMNNDGSLETGFDIFTKDMRQFCSKEFEIATVILNGGYTLRDREGKEEIKRAKGVECGFSDEVLEFVEAGKTESVKETFLQVKFVRIGRALTAEILKAPSIAIKECFESERHYSHAFKHEVDFVDGPGEMHEFALRIPYADCGRHDVMTFMYSSKEEAEKAIDLYSQIIAGINERLRIKAHVFIAE